MSLARVLSVGFRPYRLRLLLVASFLGGSLSCIRSTPLPYDISALATAVAEASGALVLPKDLRWEPSRGAIADALLGRRLLFLGVPAEGTARDLYRARVRVTPEGLPLGVAAVQNLTSTPLGDEHSLVAHGNTAAVVTFAFGQQQTVVWFDLNGEGDQNSTPNVWGRIMSALTNWQQTGATAGLGRVDVTFDDPISAVSLRMDQEALSIRATSERRVVAARLQHATRVLDGERVHAEGSRHLPKPFVFWAVDTVRAVSWIGPAPVAWLEEKVFGARDFFRRATARRAAQVEMSVESPQASVLNGMEGAADAAADESSGWPPASMASMWKNPELHEGEWLVPEIPYLKRLPSPVGVRPEDVAPAAFLRAMVRPDQDRAYAKVLLVAMDMRQLDLDMEAGVEDPKPLTGPSGAGRIPRDPRVFTRVAAAFNGGFKTEHGNYGMMLRKRVLLPPVAGAASLVLLKDGRIGMGSWGATTKVTGLLGIADADIFSMRQNLDPLIAEGVVNPSGRWQWGFTLPGSSMQTERSGICVTASGSLIYAWGDDVNGTTLGKAMKMAGCVYGMHLDMNPHHTGFIFTNISELAHKNYKSELLTTKMEIAPDRYIEYAPKDFFYVMTKNVSVLAGASGADGELVWQVDAGSQPAPTWLPSVYSAFDGEVRFTLIDQERVGFRLRAGTEDRGKGLRELALNDKKRVLLAATLGAASERKPRTLTIGGISNSAVSREEDLGLLSIDSEGVLSVAEHASDTAVDSAQLPLLIANSEERAPGQGAVHLGLGIRADGRIVLAQSLAGTGGLVSRALRKAKCTIAVALEQSAAAQPEVFRAGTAHLPRVHYKHTSLSFLAKALRPPVFVFSPQVPVVSVKKQN